MAELTEHADAGADFHANVGAVRQLVIGTLASLPGAVRALDDLERAGFTAGEIALVACVEGARQAGQVSADWICGFGELRTVVCRGLGTLLIGGGAVPPLRALGTQVSPGELGRTLADSGLPGADALIYELGLIRGQSLLAVRVATAERGQVAYRLLLRCGSQEIHVYRS
jgi:hypothetical protein